MCKVKFGAYITNMEDVRNLVTAIILRQDGYYSRSEILDCAWYYLRGCNYPVEDKDILALIDRCLDVFGRNDVVKCVNGNFYTRKAEYRQPVFECLQDTVVY